ncbi:MAG: hypothetical protein HYT88_00080 [Candidatus Omnitrophica bacterium]|nr:hypothetical protein [Candidatus Omnitrophota bacterium]MBI2174034.1 hypothetical protein [Candidatus Omnitrophota bacterium]MBI3010816.1 hypothetical protein [Candidatus Omnitrophota bacterium]
MKHVLIVGPPRVGKTTLIQRLVCALRRKPIDGFVTEELREYDQRTGFWLSPLDGRQILLAHRQLESGVRVGPYRVNTSVLDEVGVSIIRRGMKGASVLFLDELGRMELSSRALEKAVLEAFEHGPFIVATISLAPLPFLVSLKQRRDVELIPLTTSNRAVVEEELSARLEVHCTEGEAIRVLQQQAERICEMIIRGEPPIDIEIQQQALREAVARLFPDRQSFYPLLYESRFRRLWQQFRGH